MPKYDQGFGAVWSDAAVFYREGNGTSVTDYHEHDFYEINLILSGDVKILLGEGSTEGTGCRIVLTRPHSPHYIACRTDTLYSRIYLMFTEAFVADLFPEWGQLSAVFGDAGRCATLSAMDAERFRALIEEIGHEQKPFRRRLLIYYFLSLLGERIGTDSEGRTEIPQYVLEVISYLEHHCSEHIVTSDLARRMHVGRTTLMTEFKRYTDSTVGEYLAACRLKHAILSLREGKTLEEAAERCGYSDVSGLVRLFRRTYGMTPRQYLKQLGE